MACCARRHSSGVQTGRSSASAYVPPPMERQLHLLRRVGIPDGRRHGETIELALDEREGAALRMRVLRGDDQVGSGSGQDCAVHADLPLLHRLEQRRLRARWRPVQLVDQHDVREDRAGPEIPAPGVGHEDRHPCDVGREEVGVTLDPRELGAERGGERAGQHRLAHPGHVLNEQMAAREGSHGGGDQCALAAEDDLPRFRIRAWPRATASSRSRTRSSTTLIGFPPSRGPWVSTLRGHGSLIGARPFGSAWPGAIPATFERVNCRPVDRATVVGGLRRRSNTPDRSSSCSSQPRACPPRSRRTPEASCPGPVRR